MQYTLWTEQSISCMFDSSHCPDSCTPCCSANCCARSPFPTSSTACTTVFQVRGRLPVPLSPPSHFSNSSNKHSPTFDVSLLILCIMAGSTYRYVPNILHWESNWWFRALSTSRGQGENGIVIIQCTLNTRNAAMTHVVLDNQAKSLQWQLHLATHFQLCTICT